MGGSKKSRAVVGKNPPPPAAAPSLIGWFFRPSVLFQMAIVASLVALWPYAAEKLPPLKDRPEYRFSFDRIQIHPVPEKPVPQSLLAEVRNLADLPDNFSILDEDVTTEVARAFRRHPWIGRVVRIRKSFPAAIIAEVEYRQPAAMLRIADGRIPIDIQGVVLPTSDFSVEEAAQYPVIQLQTSKAIAKPGTVLDDPAILSAAQLASYLKDKWSALKLDSILVNSSDVTKTSKKDLSFVLIGRGGSRILWGRAPGIDYPGELEPTQKIRRLEKYLADFGDYLRPGGPYEIDIRHWQEISRHALVIAPAPKPAKPQKDEGRRANSEPRKKTRS